jgi:phage repressor protein C with HTH and peptisase S24 domain
MLKVRCREYLSGLQNLTGDEIPKVDIAKALIKYGVSKQKDVDKLANNISNRCFNDGYFKPEEIEVLDIVFKSNKNQLQKYDDITPQSDKVLIDYYPEVCGSCGNGVFQFSTRKEQITIPRNAFWGHLSKSKEYFVINAYGNSMEPFICDKDKLIIETWQGEQIVDNKAYLFAYKDELFIKRLAKNVDQLMIIPENKDYDIRKLEGEQLKDVNIIGQVVGLMRSMN